MNSVCVFCGSLPGESGEYRRAARHLGRLVADSGLRLVYGGGRVGLMGVLADAALAAAGHVIGVIPDALATRELAHPSLTELRVVPTMHARKAAMADLSDAFIALPGGFGTLDELVEILTWAQLGIHAKPVGILNVRGYFDPFLSLIDHAVSEGFVAPEHRDLILHGKTPEDLLRRLVAHRPPALPHQMRPEEA